MSFPFANMPFAAGNYRPRNFSPTLYSNNANRIYRFPAANRSTANTSYSNPSTSQLLSLLMQWFSSMMGQSGQILPSPTSQPIYQAPPSPAQALSSQPQAAPVVPQSQPPTAPTSNSTGTANNTAIVPSTTAQDLFREATELLRNSPFQDSVLDNLLTQSVRDQSNSTANIAYNWDASISSPIIKNGPLAGRNWNTVKTKDLVDTGSLKNDWSLSDLEAEFGAQYGKIETGLKDLNDALSKNTTYVAIPYHLGEAQKYLHEARKLEKYVKDSYADNPSINQVILELRNRAVKHYRAGKMNGSPVVLDVGGTGQINLTSLQNGVKFDLEGTGTKTQVAWTEARGKDTAAWLTLDQNGNGLVDSGKELFGNQNGAANGYDELRKYDRNQDGAIDAKDDIYGKLRLWQDINHDGISQAEEMKTLSGSGVEKINLKYAESSAVDPHGNELRQQSSFVRTDAKAQEIAQQKGVSLQQAKNGLSVDAWIVTGG